MTRGKKLVLLHAGVVCGVAVYALIMELTGIGCPIRWLTGVPCPSCGLTRATLALLRLRPQEAFAWHPMVFLIYPYLFLLFHFRTKLFAHWKKGVLIGLLAGGGVLFVVVYVIRLWNGINFY